MLIGQYWNKIKLWKYLLIQNYYSCLGILLGLLAELTSKIYCVKLWQFSQFTLSSKINITLFQYNSSVFEF